MGIPAPGLGRAEAIDFAAKNGEDYRNNDPRGISQPSLTNAIIRLEQELGGPLFERNR